MPAPGQLLPSGAAVTSDIYYERTTILHALSGLDALKKPATEEGSPVCAVVILTGAGDARLAVEAMISGAHDCLEKDYARGAPEHRRGSRNPA